jgi:hypothetical protein
MADDKNDKQLDAERAKRDKQPSELTPTKFYENLEAAIQEGHARRKEENPAATARDLGELPETKRK